MKVGLSLMNNVLTSLAKSVLVPLGLMAATSEKDGAIQKIIFGLDKKALIISNKKIDDIIKIVKFLEDTGFFIKGVSETSKNESKNRMEDLLVCYKVHYVLVYKEIWEQVKELFDLVKEQIEQGRIFIIV